MSSAGVASLAEHIAATRQGWTGAVVETVIAGVTDAIAVAAGVDEWVQRHLGAAIERAHWHHSSVGMVSALDLTDGRTVVVKGFQPRYTAGFLEAVVQVQRRLVTSRFPVAVPVAGPAPFGLGLMTAETMLVDPGVSTDRDLAASAAGLARLVRHTEGLDVPGLAPHPLTVPAGARYFEPHSPVFDFTRDAEGAAWIDELADVALAARALDRTPPVVAHTDWTARNVRWDRGGVRAVFDLDSLALVPDAVAAGQAAVTWATTMDDGEPPLPGPTGIAAFLDGYQRERGYRFAPDQVQAAWGAALQVLAYTARCEHSLGRRGLATDRLLADADELADRAALG